MATEGDPFCVDEEGNERYIYTRCDVGKDKRTKLLIPGITICKEHLPITTIHDEPYGGSQECLAAAAIIIDVF
jgi:hypothetical protein